MRGAVRDRKVGVDDGYCDSHGGEGVETQVEGDALGPGYDDHHRNDEHSDLGVGIGADCVGRVLFNGKNGQSATPLCAELQTTVILEVSVALGAALNLFVMGLVAIDGADSWRKQLEAFTILSLHKLAQDH